jgi:hypothetical protein
VLEEIPRRIVGGVMWGMAFSLVLKITRDKDGASTLRPVAKTAVKAVVLATDKLRALAEEARETIEDIYAETQAEQELVQDEEYSSHDEEIPLEVDQPASYASQESGEAGYGEGS